MLTPEYLEACADSVLGIYDELNIKIVEDIARRIAKTGTVTDSAKWQIKQVQEAGKLMDEITHEVASITGFSDAYVKELFNDAGVASGRHQLGELSDRNQPDYGFIYKGTQELGETAALLRDFPV